MNGGDTERLDLHIEPAKRCVDRECAILDDELDAFDRFRTRLSKVEPQRRPPTASMSDPTAIPNRPRSSGSTDTGASVRAAIRRAYRETVMATDHFDDEYGETYLEHVDQEFGSAFAAVLSGRGSITPSVKVQFREAVSSAISDRRAARSTFRRERRALDRAGQTLSGLQNDLVAIESRPLADCGTVELRTLRDDVAELERRCDRLVADRQRGDLHTAAILLSKSSGGSLSQFLYESLAVTYPVLHNAARIGRQLADLDDRVERHLGDRTTGIDLRGVNGGDTVDSMS
jgi:hypothetical protein